MKMYRVGIFDEVMGMKRSSESFGSEFIDTLDVVGRLANMMTSQWEEEK